MAIIYDYDCDKDEQIINGPKTTAAVTAELRSRNTVVLNWTDQEGTLMNVLLAFNAARVGAAGGQVDSKPNKLWAGIAGRGCFAFAVGGGELHPGYVGEKLGIYAAGTAIPLAELLTDVRTALAL